ncbi:MAG: hypothetical protein ACE5JL_16925, partial [Dehalococcoidia bacterium]
LGPLADIPVTFAKEQTTFLLNELSRGFPDALAPLAAALGQQAFDELKAGARPPTGREYLALAEVFVLLEEEGGGGEEPRPIPEEPAEPAPEEIKSFFGSLPPDVKAALEVSFAHGSLSVTVAGQTRASLVVQNTRFLY